MEEMVFLVRMENLVPKETLEHLALPDLQDLQDLKL